jgi:hypothetical protein
MAIAFTAMSAVFGLCATFALALFATRDHERRSIDSARDVFSGTRA